MAELAILGGAPAIQAPLGKPWPIFGDLERKLLNEVLESGLWNRGRKDDPADSMTGRFEDAFARFHDAKYALAVTNGTAAIECALKAVDVEPGDEVIVPAATFVATASAVVQVGGVPIFVDVDPRNYTIAPKAVEAAIAPQTRVVVAVDLGGMPCDMDALNALGREHGIAIVSDCAHSHGSQWKGVGVGAVGDIGAFSFQMLKTLPTGEGGMVLTNRRDLADKAYSYLRADELWAHGPPHQVPAVRKRHRLPQGRLSGDRAHLRDRGVRADAPPFPGTARRESALDWAFLLSNAPSLSWAAP